MLKRWNIYFKERFPVVPRLILGLIVFLEIYFIVLLNQSAVLKKKYLEEDEDD